MVFRRLVNMLSTFDMSLLYDSEYKTRSECISKCAQNMRKLPGRHNQEVFASLDQQTVNGDGITGFSIKKIFTRTPIHIDIDYDYQRESFSWGDNGDHVQHELWLNQGGIQYPILETRILAQCVMDTKDIRVFTNRTRFFTAIACLDHQRIDECEETNSLVRNRVLCRNHEREQPFPLLTFDEAEKVSNTAV